MNFMLLLANGAPIEPPALDFDITAIIQVCLFLLILLFLNHFVLKPYLKAHDEREGRTTGAVQEAQSLREKASAAQSEYVSKRQVVYAEIEGERKKQLREAQDAQSESLEARRAAVMKDVAQRQEAFDASMKEARAEADNQIAAISAEITRKLLA